MPHNLLWYLHTRYCHLGSSASAICSDWHSTGTTCPDCSWTTKFCSQWTSHTEPSATSTSGWPHNPATGFRPPSATVVSAEPFSHRTGTLQCLEKEMATDRQWSVSLWRDPDDVSHCRILSPDKTEWRLISATLCRWRRCFVADQLWLMKRIREEEDYGHQTCRRAFKQALKTHLTARRHWDVFMILVLDMNIQTYLLTCCRFESEP